MDKPADLKLFKDKNKFSYPLLSDPEAKVVDAFGVMKIRETMCGRQSFLVKEGAVIWNDLNAESAKHAEDELKALDEIAPTSPADGKGGKDGAAGESKK